MKTFLLARWVVMGALALATVLPATLPQPAAAQADPVAERKAGFKRMGGHLEAIKALLDNPAGLRAEAGRASDMQAFFGGLPALFPPGSDKGETRALPAVWSDRAGFEAAGAGATAAAAKLQQAMAAGDTSAAAGAFREMGGACGTCHRGYRGR
ncbi:cytochrome c [Roseomonas sp. 18066]|uniref:c-type cytochrome n=1 Tax=Roseomonas sp. 18066 TaxID=2681412 RepID=UPI001359133B|nr:cytochrome c [Roseomonas sp. 18066]